jgi:hypothetical protein
LSNRFPGGDASPNPESRMPNSDIVFLFQLQSEVDEWQTW